MSDMKKILYILLLMLPIASVAAPKKAPKSTANVAVYNVTSSGTRADDVSKGKAPGYRLWSNSVSAMAEQIAAMDCDIVGLLDVCDSISGRKGEVGLPQALKDKGVDYTWLVLSNTRPSLPIEGAYNRTQAIIWKTGKYDCIDWGINWLGGYHDKNRIIKGLSGDATRSMTWAKFREKATGKEFYVMVAAINGASNADLNRCNCENLIKIADEIVVLDDKPSIILGNFYMQDNTPGYTDVLSQSRWFDVYARLKEQGMLADVELKNNATRNGSKGTSKGGGRPDYIFVDGFQIETYMVGRAMYEHADGTMGFPSYCYPIMTTLTF